MKRMSFVLLLAAVCGPPPATAQPASQSGPTIITLRPAAGPVPALKYRLVPERRTLVPGNAAIFYHRAIQLVLEKRIRTFRPITGAGAVTEPVEQQISDWVSGPIADIRREDARKGLEPFQAALKEVDLGAKRSFCDWEFDRRNEGVSLLIPEIQEMRSLARLVALRARLAIVEGNIDDAMHWLETGLIMGRHVGQGPTMIQGFVGVAINAIMLTGLEDLIQVPGMPSLYWALAIRPRPFLDLSAPLEGERYVLEQALPELEELDREPWSVDRTRRFTDDLQRRLPNFDNGESLSDGRGTKPSGIDALPRQLGVAAMAAKIYPEARRALLACGRSETEVDAMPVVQVAALYTYQEYQRLRDESYKWMGIPYWQSYDETDRSTLSATTIEQKLANPLLTLFRLLTPALKQARLAYLRLERRLDALQCIEAIRIYAAATGGKLPPSLEALTGTPVPLDQATGKPFSYKFEGDSATLSAPPPPGGPDHPYYAIHFVLKLAH